MQSVQRCLNLLFQHSLFLTFFLFQKYLKPKVRTTKLVNSVVYHPCSSRLASGIHPFSLNSISFRNACWIFSDLYIPAPVEKFFQFMVFTLEIALNLCIFTHAAVPHSTLQGQIFENQFRPWAKNNGVEEIMICFIKVQSENMKMTWNISLLIFCMIYNFSKCGGFTVLWIISIN